MNARHGGHLSAIASVVAGDKNNEPKKCEREAEIRIKRERFHGVLRTVYKYTYGGRDTHCAQESAQACTEQKRLAPEETPSIHLPNFVAHQWEEKYSARVFPCTVSIPFVPDLVWNSVPKSSGSGFGRHGKFLPSGSVSTASRPSVVMTSPLSSSTTMVGIPRTLNLVFKEFFLSLGRLGRDIGPGRGRSRKRGAARFLGMTDHPKTRTHNLVPNKSD